MISPGDVPDLFDRAFARDPLPATVALREKAPVHHDPGTGLWLVSRYEDVRAILFDPDAFRPDNAIDAFGNRHRHAGPVERRVARTVLGAGRRGGGESPSPTRSPPSTRG
jgi:cytochrome P450